MTHPEFKVRRPGTSYFRLDILVTSQGVPFIAKKVCHHNQVAKFRVTINLTLMAISGWRWTVFRCHFDGLSLKITLWNRDSSVDIFSGLRAGKPTSLFANSDRRKIFISSSIMFIKHLQLSTSYPMNTEGPFHKIKLLRLRLRRLFFF